MPLQTIQSLQIRLQAREEELDRLRVQIGSLSGGGRSTVAHGSSQDSTSESGNRGPPSPTKSPWKNKAAVLSAVLEGAQEALTAMEDTVKSIQLTPEDDRFLGSRKQGESSVLGELRWLHA